MKNNDRDQNTVQYLPIGMCIGIGVGMAIGSALGSIPVGMCIGMSIGLGIGALADASRKKKTDDSADVSEDEENIQK